jgi:hypothetical protein
MLSAPGLLSAFAAVSAGTTDGAMLLAVAAGTAAGASAGFTEPTEAELLALESVAGLGAADPAEAFVALGAAEPAEAFVVLDGAGDASVSNGS